MERFTISIDEDLAQEFDAMVAERGVRHGQVNIVSVDLDRSRHNHGYAPTGKVVPHLHLKPKS